MSSKRATLKDIANYLDVSTTTVHRALNNHPDISKKLKEQILFVADTLNYRPNYLASSLRTQRSKMIGVILPKISHYFYSTVLSGIIKTAYTNGYRTIVTENRNDRKEEKKMVDHLINTDIDGILVAVSNDTKNEDHLRRLVVENIPHVFFDKVPENIKGPKVLIDDFKGAYLATKHLIEQGYQKIAHIKGQEGSRNAHSRYLGYLKALNDYGIKYQRELVWQCKYGTEKEGFEMGNDLLKLKDFPDAYFTVNDEIAIGLISAFNKRNIKIPQNVGIVGFCNSITSQFINPSLSSVEQYGFKIGEKSTVILLNIINGKSRREANHDSKKIIIEPNLIIRTSSNKNSIKNESINSSDSIF